MSFLEEHPLESNTIPSTRDISKSSNKIEEDDNLASESSSKSADNDHHTSSMQGIIIDQDHRSEGVQSLKGGSDERKQENGKLATAACDGGGESLTGFASKIRHFRSHSTVPVTSDLDRKLPFGTSQGDNSGHNKWPTVSADRIKHTRSRSSVADVFDPKKVVIETKAPIDSVKAAISKFGRVRDSKPNKLQTVERTKVIDEEIQKVQEEIPLYKEQAEIAEHSKIQMLKELENSKRLIVELKLSLEKAKTEESQAQQDSQLAKLRLEELATGVAHEASMVTKTELEMAKNRHQAAISDLKYVEKELESLQEKYAVLLTEKDLAVKKAEAAVFAWKEMERTVETLTVELVSTKEELESANAAHYEAEEHRIGALMAKEQDLYTWDKELKEIQENLVHLHQQIESAKVLKSKLSKASSRLADLKAELAVYMDPKIRGNGDKTRAGMKAVTLATNNELEDVKRRLNKATDEINCLTMASTSLKAELEKEQSELVQLRQREGMASIAVASLDAELDKIDSEIAVVKKREKEARERMEDLPRQLQQAYKETEDAKSEAELAHEEMKMAKEKAELAKAEVKTIESRLRAAQKEIEATRASERLALAAIKALQESESTKSTIDDSSTDKVTLTLEEYYKLSKRAHKAEKAANEKVADAISKIEEAKEDELKSMKQLEDAVREVDERKKALRIAQEKAERAQEGKLRVEHELRKRRSEHEQRRKAGETGQRSSSDDGQGRAHLVGNQTTDGAGPAHESSSPGENDETSPKEEVFGHANTMKKKKKSIIPKIFMFFGKKHWKSSSKS